MWDVLNSFRNRVWWIVVLRYVSNSWCDDVMCWNVPVSGCWHLTCPFTPTLHPNIEAMVFFIQHNHNLLFASTALWENVKFENILTTNLLAIWACRLLRHQHLILSSDKSKLKPGVHPNTKLDQAWRLKIQKKPPSFWSKTYSHQSLFLSFLPNAVVTIGLFSLWGGLKDNCWPVG